MENYLFWDVPMLKHIIWSGSTLFNIQQTVEKNIPDGMNGLAQTE